MTTTTTPITQAATVTRVRHIAHYITHSVLLTLKDWSFLAFVIAMPTAMYLFFVGIYGDEDTAGGVKASAVMMVTMATYGALGAAMTAGAQIQNERSTGWFRQLMLTGLTPAQFLSTKIAVAIVVITPAIVAVFVSGAYRGVRLAAATWLASGALILVSLLPMVILGLVLGLWFKPAAANAAVTLTMLVLSMLGGLWFPLSMMPSAMATIGRQLPSHWAGQIGVWPIAGGDFPWRGVWVIGVWTVALIVLGVVGYRRAVRVSRR